jgi:diguanylate cyclase (GGDEF)-like protein/PAS domain S-box-containing protein
MGSDLVGMVPLISLLLQIAAAVLALNLVQVTNWRIAWLPIAAAVFLMAAGQGFSTLRLLQGAPRPPTDLGTELMALSISILLLAGIASIAPLFRAHRKGEQALRRSEERYRRMIDAAGDGIWLLDENARTIYVNQRMTEMLGYSAKEMLGRPIFEFMDPRARMEAELSFKRHRLGVQEQHDLRLRCKDGSDLWTIFSANLLTDENGQILGSLGMVTDITGRKAAETRLRHRAQRDVLTGLPNRILLIDRLNQALKQARRTRKMVAVLFLDLDSFKPINDTLGHRAGDLVLQEVGLRLRSRVRQLDTVARYGGDEFVIVLQGLDDLQEVAGIAANLVKLLKQPFEVDGILCNIGVSIGISVYPADGEKADILLKEADEAMYLAKGSELKKFQFFSDPAPGSPAGKKQNVSRVRLVKSAETHKTGTEKPESDHLSS